MAKESSHVTKFRDTHIKPDEKIIATADGFIGKMMGRGDDKQHNGALIVTNERVVFYRKGFIGEVFEAIPIKNISAVDTATRALFHIIRIATSNKDLECTIHDKKLLEACRSAIDSARERGNAANENNSSGAMTQLKELASLKDAGVLTEEEFEAKKRQLLDRI